jgi:hypothetical protein
MASRAPMAGGFDHRTDVGVEPRAPFGAEAVGDFAEHGARPQGALGAVVGRRQIAVGHEDEEIAPRSFDHALEFDAGFVRRRARHELVETGVEPTGVGLQRRVGQSLSSSADPAGAPQQMAQAGGENIVAGVDRILHIAAGKEAGMDGKTLFAGFA